MPQPVRPRREKEEEEEESSIAIARAFFPLYSTRSKRVRPLSGAGVSTLAHIDGLASRLGFRTRRQLAQAL